MSILVLFFLIGLAVLIRAQAPANVDLCSAKHLTLTPQFQLNIDTSLVGNPTLTECHTAIPQEYFAFTASTGVLSYNTTLEGPRMVATLWEGTDCKTATAVQCCWGNSPTTFAFPHSGQYWLSLGAGTAPGPTIFSAAYVTTASSRIPTNHKCSQARTITNFHQPLNFNLTLAFSQPHGLLTAARELWYKFSPPLDATAELNVTGEFTNAADNQFGFFTTADPDCANLQPETSPHAISVQRGLTYYFVLWTDLFTYSNDAMTGSVSVNFLDGPTNTVACNAKPIDFSVSSAYNIVVDLRQVSPPTSTFCINKLHNQVFYTIVPPFNGLFQFNWQGSLYPTEVIGTVWSSPTCKNLTNNACGWTKDLNEFYMDKGVRYWIAFMSYSGPTKIDILVRFSKTLKMPPFNRVCSNALAVTNHEAVEFDLALASPHPLPGGIFGVAKSLWYNFTATSTGTGTVAVAGAFQNNVDKQYGIFSTPNFTCSQHFTAPQSHSVSMTKGNTYYVLIWMELFSYSNDYPTGVLMVNLGKGPSNTDLCHAKAIEITTKPTTEYILTTQLVQETYTPCTVTTPRKQQYYTFTASQTGVVTITSTASQYVATLWSGEGCTTAKAVACGWGVKNGLFAVKNGTHYWLSFYDAETTSNFDVVMSFTPGAVTVPTNRLCEGSAAATPAQPTPFNLTFANPSGPELAIGLGGPLKTLWYHFISPTSHAVAKLTVTGKFISGTDNNFGFLPYQASGSYCTSLHPTADHTINVEAGKKYMFVVWIVDFSFSSDPFTGTFTLNIVKQ